MNVTKRDNGKITRIEKYSPITLRKNDVNTTKMKLKSFKTAEQLAIEKKESEAKKAAEKAKKARKEAIKKRNLQIKRAAAKAKGCKGLYTGKGVKVTKKLVSIMDLVNIFDPNSLNDFYEINGVDSNSKSATLRHTKSGKLINTSCLEVQLLMK